jgi:hypothetical protein
MTDASISKVQNVELRSPTLALLANEQPVPVSDGGRTSQHNTHSLNPDVEMVSTEAPPAPQPGSKHTNAKFIIDDEADELQAAALDFLRQ